MSGVFHFKMDVEMKQRLKALGLFSGRNWLSKTLRYILVTLYPLLEKEHFYREFSKKQYALVHKKKEVKRISGYVNLPRYLYKRLKLVHHDLGFFSIAQVVRRLLLVWLDLAELYGDDFETGLKRLIKKCKKEIGAVLRMPNLFQQLLRKKGDQTGNPVFFTFYNDHFSPEIIIRC